MKTDKDRTGREDWQKADARILGQILAAQNIEFALPDTTHVAEFFAEMLTTVPGIVSCRVCLEDVIAQKGEMESRVCEECHAIRKKIAGQQEIPLFRLDFKCRLANQPDIQFNAINTLHHHFGFFIFQVDDSNAFNVYKPFIGNLANYVAISLDNRLQRDLLQKAHNELEHKVKERTQNLVAANAHLQEEIEIRRQTEEALRVSEKQIKQLIDASPIAMIVSSGIEEHVESVNDKFIELFGFTIEDIPDAAHWWPLAYPDEKYRDEIKTQWQARVEKAILDEDQTEPMEATVMCKDGSHRYIEFRYSSIGRQHLVTFVDLTERRSAEVALRESEEKYRTLIQKIQAAVIVHGPDTKILTSNSMAQELLGVTESQILGKTASDPAWHFFLEDGTAMPFEEYPVNQVLASHKILRNFIMGVHRPGKENDVWALVNADPVFVNEDEIVQVIVTFIDITERVRAEQELRETQERFAAAFHASPNLIAITRMADGKIVEVNEGYSQLLGYSRAESIGRTTAELSIWANAADRATFIASLEESGQITGFETMLRRKDGTLMAAIDSARSIKLQNEMCVLSIVHDITERKRVENIRQARLRLLEFSVSHSLDELLTATLDEIEALTGSSIGFYHFVEADQKTLFLQNWSTNTLKNMCTAEGKGSHYDVDQAGVWVDCVYEHRPIIHNDYASLPASRRKGMPEGHAPVVREVVVPIFRGDQIRAIVGVGNKTSDYNESDIEIVSQLGDLSWDIAERKRAEESLRKSEQEFRSLAENSPDVIVRYDREGRRIYVNPEFERVNHLSAQEVQGKTPVELSTELAPMADVFTEKLMAAMASGTVEEIDLSWTKNGKLICWFVRLVPEFDADNKVVSALTIWSDITERKQHENEREVIVQISNALRAANTRAEMLPILLDQVNDMFHADGATITMSQPITGRLLIELGRGTFGENFTGITLSPGEGVSGRVMDSGKPYLCNDLKADPTFAYPELLGEANAVACAPLIAHELTIGALWIIRARDITEGELRLLVGIANIAANAIQRVTLFEQTQRQLHQLIALHQIDTTISSSFDLAITLNVFLNNVIAQLGVDAADILLLTPYIQILEYSAGIGFWTRKIEQSRIRLGDGQVGLAALQHQIVSLPDLGQAHENFTRSALLAEEKFVSHYIAPLIAKGQIKGVLEIFTRERLDATQEWLDFFETLATQAAIAIDSASLFSNLQRSNTELRFAYDATIEGWSRALDMRDKETEGHSQRVTETALQLAGKMGMSDADKVDLRRGALLHDIGKMGIPDSILLKPGELTVAEWEIMRQHPAYAYQMLEPISYLRGALDVPYCHHEKWDGTGYPRGLKGKQIPLSARIFAIADMFDALTSDRPYRKAWSPEEAYRYVQEQSGKHFDPDVASAFLEMQRAS